MLNNTLGERVKALRESLHLNRQQFADNLDCSLSHIINIEKNRASLSEKLMSVAIKAFSLPETFFDGADTPDSSLDKWDIEIGMNIKRLRQEKGLTQGELAEEIGFSGASSISAVETAKKSLSKTKLMQLAKYFEVNLTELLRVQSNPPEVNRAESKLIEDFAMLVRSPKKPAVYDLILRLLTEAQMELASTRKRG